ncbi:PREDICTED: uncharacterized protein LOC109487211 [Branchiostoma belcheri]|uniref:Uncharacterized protein LOC109487211 n=1 Tax=Branchiostoma belcheri TaxID=7741 RepID=A0A6P5A083_BRABE|nr:PREDICTED: uncharacterized protein LOC109487211 [Branchiostoma belcheri]
MPRRKKKKLTERLSAWKEEQKTEKQPCQQDDKQAEVESVQEVESGVQEPAEMLMEVEVSGDEPVDDQDVQETGAWDNEEGFIFDPFTGEDQLNVASMVNRYAQNENEIITVKEYHNMEQRNVPLKTPCSSGIVPIRGDGNCFYNAISYNICGTEEYHKVLRQHLIKFMSTLPENVYRSWFDGGLTMCQYLNRRDERGKRPGDLGAWASQVEMDAMALFLGVRIYLYTKYGKEWTWFKYPSNESIGDQILLEPGNAIYLNHANQNHFEVVTKVWSCQETRSTTLCQGEESTEVSPVTSSKRKTTLNDNVEDRKKAKRERERKRYQEDEKYAQSQRDRKKTRYHTDEQYAQEKRDKTKERYHTDEEHAQAERDRKKERYHTDEEHAQARKG